MSIAVTLTSREILHAGLEATMRQVMSVQKERKDTNQAEQGRAWEYHIKGAIGELVLAKHLKRYWGGASGFKGEDVIGCEVKTRGKHHFDLILRGDEAPDIPVVLVTGRKSPFRIHGWILPKDGWKDEYLNDYSGRKRAYFVPQSKLHPFETLFKPRAPETEEWPTTG